jgi:hypothetical protein
MEINKYVSEINRLLGVIEGASHAALRPAAVKIREAAQGAQSLLAVYSHESEGSEFRLASEVARLQKQNIELEEQIRRMKDSQCRCECDWRMEDDGK